MKKNGEYDPPKNGSLKKMCRIMKVTMLLLLFTMYRLSERYMRNRSSWILAWITGVSRNSWSR